MANEACFLGSNLLTEPKSQEIQSSWERFYTPLYGIHTECSNRNMLFSLGMVALLISSSGGGCLVRKSCPNYFATPWTAARQAPLSMGFLRQEYSDGLLFPSQGDLLNPRIEPAGPCMADSELSGKPSSSSMFVEVKSRLTSLLFFLLFLFPCCSLTLTNSSFLFGWIF